MKSVLNDWITFHDSSNIESTVASLTKEYLSTEHQVLQKAVTDLSTKIDVLTAQESELSSQITKTSKAIQPNTTSTYSQPSDRKSNVVVYGVEESPPNTPRGTRLQKDTVTVSKIFGSMNIDIESTQILDCYRLGKYRQLQPRPRPILVKLQRAIDASSILANRASLKSPVFIKPDLSPAEQKVESILLKERWTLIQGGHDRKAIKINSRTSSLYLNNKVYGKVVNSQFQRSAYFPPNPTTTTTLPMELQEPLISLASPITEPSGTSHSSTSTSTEVQLPSSGGTTNSS